MTSIMVSYSRKDSVAARKLINSFTELGLDVWVDWEDIPPAVGWLNQILRGIEESDAFIFLISPDSIASEICNEEITHAGKNNKRIIPIVVRDVDAKTVNPIIRELNWIFAREQDTFEECLAKIKLAIDLDLEWVEEHRRLQVRALEWDRKKDVSLLLRGGDLRYASKMVTTASNKNPNPTDLQHIYIHHSRRDERFRIAMWVAIGFAVVILGIVAFIAYNQYRLEAANARLAIDNQRLAEENAAVEKQRAEIALENERIARESEALAVKSENIAEAGRSAARAQIYQSRTGELFTSTLLAIDSWRREPSPEIEEILRKNISLLPIPVAQMSQAGQINSLVFSPTDNMFVTASADSTLCGWDVSGGENLFCETSSGSINDAAFSPNGEVIVTGDQNGRVLILNAKNHEDRRTRDFGVPIWDVDVSPDSNSLAVTKDDGTITIMDLTGQKADTELSTVGRPFVSMFSPDGLWFAAGSNSGGITIWNLRVRGAAITGKAIHRGEVLALQFSPDSSILVSGGADNKAFVTQTSTGNRLYDVINQGQVQDLAFSPDGSWFVTVSDDRSIRVWDTETGDERVLMLQDGLVKEVAVSPDGRWIATTGEDRTARVWNSGTGAEMLQIPLKSSGATLTFSNDGKYLISGTQNGEINIWDITTMTVPVSEIQFREFTGNAQFSPSGDWLAASVKNQVWLLDRDKYSSLSTSPQGSPILELNREIKNLVFSPDSKWIAVSAERGELALYNVETKFRRIISQSNSAQKLAISPDSQQLITGSLNGAIQTRELTTGRAVQSLYKADSGVMSLAASSELLAIGLVDKVIILNMNTKEVVDEIESPGGNELMVFNAQGSLLALRSSPDQITIWKQENGEFTLHQTLSRGSVFSMAFRPEGNQILVGERNMVYLIDTSTGEEVLRIPQKTAANSLSFSPEGNLYATASLKVIQIWDITKISNIDSDHLIETACNRMFENFDETQWAMFFGDEKYEPSLLCPDS